MASAPPAEAPSSASAQMSAREGVVRVPSWDRGAGVMDVDQGVPGRAA